jgi:two-component system sensor histidine kinase BaeS
MRTKLFFAFIFIIFLALLSNVVFERLIINDFNEFINGTKEDHIYWIMSSVEGSFRDKNWSTSLLSEALHWSMMLGFESYVEDLSGKRVLSSSDVLSTMNPNMIKRMSSFINLTSAAGDFAWYPLYIEGVEIGKLYVRPLEKFGVIPQKEEVFRKRGKEFLIISFLIAGGGALVLSILFTVFLSNPIRRLTDAAEKIAKGEFSVQGPKLNRKLKDEIDKLANSFNYMAEALRREDALRKHLTSNIAHELRTPLTIIRGNLEASEDGIISDQRVTIENIRSEIQRIITLVEGIEDFTRAEASFFKRGPLEKVNLREFMESASESMRHLVEEKGLYLKLEGPSMQVRTYPEKLHIIVKNLLSNAYKFTIKGGIALTWGYNAENSTDGFFVSVKDTGTGIEREMLLKIFERFHKGEASDGKGLGLAIVKELTEVMGGRTEVESSPEQGATFKVYFD